MLGTTKSSPRHDQSCSSATMPSTTIDYVEVSRHDNEKLAKIKMRSYDGCHYNLKHNTGKRGVSKVYVCVEHVECGFYHRIRAEDQNVFVLEAGGQHSATLSSRKRKGIHPALKGEVDDKGLGAGPSKILTTLQTKYRNDERMLAILPSTGQIKSRKGHTTKKLAKKWEIATYADLLEWAGVRMCTTERHFFGDSAFNRATDEAVFASKPAAFQDATVVLDCFDHKFSEEGVTKTSFGLIFTSRRVFRNVFYAVEGQQAEGVFAAADGTYKLHYGT